MYGELREGPREDGEISSSSPGNTDVLLVQAAESSSIIVSDGKEIQQKILTRLSMRTHLPLTSAVVNSLKFKDICASAIKETLLQSDVKITGKLSNTRLSKEI
ncbi:hypothetical protein Pmani_031402 [Petrolisthes manimaculis]|uniref:Uncharacterized protein n=1 Tax=Petrolisthes manimaculis TaxID=1843537 RepID=A0AAE1NUS4_9EUCA|nr:hypothetical protein Pmani_031402 [Petrolisthes manimaculis]